MRKELRNKTSVDLRVSPCDICGFPLSDKHHILEFKTHGESLHVWWLCPNCHSLLHIAIGAIIFKRKRSTEVWEAFKAYVGNVELVKKIEDKVYETAEFSVEMEIKHY